MRGLLLALWLAPAALAVSGSHEAPEKTRVVETGRQNVLAEMWQRRILTTDASQWSPDDMALLLRMRAAEAGDALALLKRRYHTLKGFTVVHRAAGSDRLQVRLTKDGFERYLFTKTQDALDYFESRDIGAKWAYQLTDLKGVPLFQRSSGLLTEAGDALFSKAAAGEPAWWKTPAGEVQGNRPPPK